MVTGPESHAMLTLPVIAQRSANLGVTIIENVCDPVPRCPNDRGICHCRPFCPVLFDPPICYRLGPFDGKSPLCFICVSSPRAKQRSVGQQSCTVFAFLFAGHFFPCNCGVVVCPCMYVPVTAARAFSTSLTGRYRVVYDN